MYKLCDYSKIIFKNVGAGIKRKIMAYNDDLMVVDVFFEKGAIGSMHAHVHTQITHCISGKFKYIIGNEEFILQVGDDIAVPSNIEHGIICLESGEVLDIFSPCRKDYLKDEE